MKNGTQSIDFSEIEVKKIGNCDSLKGAEIKTSSVPEPTKASDF
jgi:hypothetical protein